MKKLALVTAGLVVGASVAFAATELFRASGAAEYVVEAKNEHGNQITKTETRFFEQSLYEGARLYKVIERSSFNTGLDGYDAKSVIEAFKTTNTMFDTKAWSLNIAGGDFKVLNDHLVQVSVSGCCDSPTLNHIINVEAGQVVVTALDSTATELSVPNSSLESRYIAEIQDSQAPAQKGTKVYIGSFGYFMKSKLKSVARIYANVPQGWGASFYDVTPVLRAKDEYRENSRYGMNTITLWNTDKSIDAATAFAGVGMKGKLSYADKNETFSVVVSSDRFSASKSKVSADLALDLVNF